MHGHLARLGSTTLAEVGKHALQLLAHLLHARWRHDFHTRRIHVDLNLDFLVIKIPFTQLLAKLLPGGVLLRGLRSCR